MKETNSPTDVIVVGAGLAGLNAARKLVAHGLTVRVLEARNEVGGRTKTVQINGHAFDVGGQWTGPGQPRMSTLIDELGLETTPTHSQGKRVLDLAGTRSTYRGTIPILNPWTLLIAQLSIWKIDRLCKQVPKDHPWRCPKAAEWDQITALEWAQSHVRNVRVIAMVNAAVRVIFGSDMAELSFLHFLFYLHSGGGLTKLIESHDGQQDRWIVGGAQQLCKRMAESIDAVHCGEPVQSIRQCNEQVEVVTSSHHYMAQRAIITVPIPLISRIRFEPALPAARQALHEQSQMGATTKVLALYDTSFWRERGLSGESVCTEGPVTVTFDDTTPSGQPCLLTFVTGPLAREWSMLAAEKRREVVLNHLAQIFGEEARHPTHYYENDWDLEAHIEGAPIATFPNGVLSKLGSVLRQPVGRIHWAGTETALDSTGFMEGALESGERAAEEVWADLNSKKLDQAY